MRKVERALKRVLIRAAPAIFPARPAAPGRPLRKILLVRVDDRLGNLVLLSPTLEWIRRVRPDLRVELLLSKAFTALYAHDPRVDGLVVLDKAEQKTFFPIFFKDLARVASGDYDAVLECSNRDSFSFSSALYARSSGSPRRIGYGNELSGNYLSEEVPSPPLGSHASRDPLLLAAAMLGLTPPPLEESSLSVHLPLPSAAWARTLEGLARGAEDRIIGIHVGGRGAKRWPLDRFVQLARDLLAEGYRPWIVSGPREGGDVSARFHPLTKSGLAMIPRAGIVEIGQAFLRCRLVIAPDTGPMHLASAVGVPTLALFLSSDAARYRPIGPQDRVLDARGDDLAEDRVRSEALSILRGTAP